MQFFAMPMDIFVKWLSVSCPAPQVGGYVGMFLGLSVWGVVSIVKDLALMLREKMGKRRMLIFHKQ